MNNEPVAWMYRMKDSTNKWELIFNKPINDEFFETIPLYTHPAELTDEDLEVITEALLMVGFTDAFINYELKEKALAILRKASEK